MTKRRVAARKEQVKKARRRLGIGGVKWTECGCGSAQPAVVKAPTARDWLPNLHLLSQPWPITASITLTNRDLIARSRLLFAAPIAPVPLRLSLPPRKESSLSSNLLAFCNRVSAIRAKYPPKYFVAPFTLSARPSFPFSSHGTHSTLFSGNPSFASRDRVLFSAPFHSLTHAPKYFLRKKTSKSVRSTRRQKYRSDANTSFHSFVHSFLQR